MRLRGIRLIGFGKFSEVRFELGPVTVFHGPNEAGKSTVCDALYDLIASGRKDLDRYGRAGERRVEGEWVGEEWHVPASLFSEVYAIRSGRVEVDFSSQRGAAQFVQEQLFAGGVNLERLILEVEKAGREVGRETVQMRERREVRARLAEVDAQIRRWEERLSGREVVWGELRRMEERLGALERERRGVEERERELDRRIQEQEEWRRLRELEQAWERVRRVREIEEEVGRLRVVCGEGVRQEGEALRREWDACREEVRRLGEEVELRKLDLRRAEEALAGVEERVRGREEKERVLVMGEGWRRRGVWMMLAGGVGVCVGVGMAGWPGWVGAGVGLAVAGLGGMVVGLVWRVRGTGMVRRVVGEGRLREAWARWRAEGEGVRREWEVWREEVRRLGEEVEGVERAWVEARRREEEAGRRLREWLGRVGARTWEEYGAEVARYREVVRSLEAEEGWVRRAMERSGKTSLVDLERYIAMERDGCRLRLRGEELTEEERIVLRNEREDLRKVREGLDREYEHVLEEVARLKGRMGNYSEAMEELFRLRGERERLFRELSRLEAEKSAYALLTEVFSRLRERMAKDFAGLVSRVRPYYEMITGGGEREVMLDTLSLKGIRAMDAQGIPRELPQLSKGTMGAFYLGCRLAMAELSETPGVIVLDEAFESLDPSRRRGAVRALHRLVDKGWQICLFTSFPDVVSVVREEFPDARIHDLGGDHA
ncbi:ATP-binding protein [Spirochaeta thermophila]|uniref:Rad50/SbcC-type AAA domain-containing protein n=1 Tax=Winmispira thermophila (strain ATCC 49972 / DSM 6192 / RI 19.B1) TaxID=665571 RepID=E0RRD5_WINT6|nr:AAA family ATPase [Spirochaeta thermophila]ADN03112.1 hypothetical protein STHERM_c21830 [Spirochaeta thermophila DSM 6192]